MVADLHLWLVRHLLLMLVEVRLPRVCIPTLQWRLCLLPTFFCPKQAQSKVVYNLTMALTSTCTFGLPLLLLLLLLFVTISSISSATLLTVRVSIVPRPLNALHHMTLHHMTLNPLCLHIPLPLSLLPLCPMLLQPPACLRCLPAVRQQVQHALAQACNAQLPGRGHVRQQLRQLTSGTRSSDGVTDRECCGSCCHCGSRCAVAKPGCRPVLRGQRQEQGEMLLRVWRQAVPCEQLHLILQPPGQRQAGQQTRCR